MCVCVFTAAPSSPEVWERERGKKKKGAGIPVPAKLQLEVNNFYGVQEDFYGGDALVTQRCPRNQWLPLNHPPALYSGFPEKGKCFHSEEKPSAAGCESAGWVSGRDNL